MNILVPSSGSALLVAAAPETALLAVLGGAVAIGLSISMLLLLARNFLHICRPNEVLIFTGRRNGPLIVRPRAPRDGPETEGGGKGRMWRIPIIERVDRMDMTTMSIDVVVQNAYSAGNIPLRIHAVANVKIHSAPGKLRNAIERFLGHQRDEVRLVAQQTLEGALREVLAQMTPEGVNEDRLSFADNLATSAQDDLDKLGLQLDTLKIQNVSDETGYLDSLGRPAIAQALRDAENAENQAMQEIAEAQARAHQRSELARATAQTATARKHNELAKVVAELDGKAQAVEREAEVAAKTARAVAEQLLQQVRAELEEKRLQAEVIIPAEFQRQAQAILARGDAAPTVEHGKAVVEVFRATANAWKHMGPQAREIYVIQHLEEIVSSVIDHVRGIEVGEVNILDPGDGSGVANYAASFPNTIATVLRALGETTGIDVTAILAGSSTPTNPPSALGTSGAQSFADPRRAP